MMKILHLISSGGFFGAENVIVSLARCLNCGEISSVIAALADSRNPHLEIVERARNLNIPVVVLESKGKLDLSLIGILKRYIKENKVDILHTHNYKSNMVGFFAARLAGVPVVATAHGYTDMNRKVAFYEKLDRLVLRFFDKVVVVTDKLLPDFPVKKRFVIQNGIEVGQFREGRRQVSEIRKEYGIKDDEIVIGTVGRLSKEKNQAMLIDAAEIIFRKFPNTRFLIVGSGPEEFALKEKVRKAGLGGRIIFLGLMTDLPAVYGVMDIFVLTSLTEGVPLTVLEAMAAKVPVVATRVGGIPGIIENNKTGFLATSENLQDFSDKLNILINDRYKREEFASVAFQYVKENFSLEKMAKNYHRVYGALKNLS